jgi:hypothetical protein
MFLTTPEFQELERATKGSLTAYQWLARAANDEGRMTWSIVNKFHFWKHLCDQSEYLNPIHVWCYMGEDYVGACSDVGASCLPGTGISQVNRKLAERARLARYVQLSRGMVASEE